MARTARVAGSYGAPLSPSLPSPGWRCASRIFVPAAQSQALRRGMWLRCAPWPNCAKREWMACGCTQGRSSSPLDARAEALGSAVGRGLADDLAAGVALDVHAADQILVYLALAGGESSFTVRSLTGHARTAMWLIEQFLPVRFEGVQLDGKVLVRVITRQRGPARPA